MIHVDDVGAHDELIKENSCLKEKVEFLEKENIALIRKNEKLEKEILWDLVDTLWGFILAI